MNLGELGRNPSELDCLNALLPPELWGAILTATNARMSKEKASDNISPSRHYVPATIDLLKRIFFARLDMITRGVRTIEEAFKVQ